MGGNITISINAIPNMNTNQNYTFNNNVEYNYKRFQVAFSGSYRITITGIDSVMDIKTATWSQANCTIANGITTLVNVSHGDVYYIGYKGTNGTIIITQSTDQEEWRIVDQNGAFIKTVPGSTYSAKRGDVFYLEYRQGNASYVNFSDGNSSAIDITSGNRISVGSTAELYSLHDISVVGLEGITLEIVVEHEQDFEASINNSMSLSLSFLNINDLHSIDVEFVEPGVNGKKVYHTILASNSTYTQFNIVWWDQNGVDNNIVMAPYTGVNLLDHTIIGGKEIDPYVYNNGLGYGGVDPITLKINNLRFNKPSNPSGQDKISHVVNIEFLVDHKFADGTGTQTDPYLISNFRHLDNIRRVENFGLGKYFELTTNISSPDGFNWPPIEIFKGFLEGNDYSINNLEMEIPDVEGSYGFIVTNNGNIKNLGVASAYIRLRGYVAEVTECGFIAASNHGIIVDCNVTGSTFSGAYIESLPVTYAGGICGSNSGTVEDCYVGTAHIQITQGFVGGIVGKNSGLVKNNEVVNTDIYCYSYFGNTNYDEYYLEPHYAAAGGIIGYHESGNTQGSVLNDVTVNYHGVSSTESALKPEMGRLVGRLNTNATLESSPNLTNVVVNSGALNATYNQTQYVGTNRNYGRQI